MQIRRHGVSMMMVVAGMAMNLHLVTHRSVNPMRCQML